MTECNFCHRDMPEEELWQSQVDLNVHYCANDENCVKAWGEYLRAGAPVEHK